MQYATKATCTRWGAQKGARRVSGLTADEKAAVRAGAEIRIAGCPPVRGVTDRRIVESSGRFYTRMPV